MIFLIRGWSVCTFSEVPLGCTGAKHLGKLLSVCKYRKWSVRYWGSKDVFVLMGDIPCVIRMALKPIAS